MLQSPVGGVAGRTRSGRTSEEAARDDRAIAMLVAARAAPPPERRRIHQRVAVAYMGVARSVAGRYSDRSHDARDVRQVAYVGLMKAIQRFEPSRGRDVVSFLVPTVAGEIKRYLRDATWLVRPPRGLQELRAELHGAAADLAQRLGREPSAAQLAAETGRPVAVVDEALECGHGRRPVSLDVPLDGDASAGGPTLGESLPATDCEFERTDLSLTLADACRGLTRRERTILELRFVQECTQVQIAEQCGVSQMQVSRLLAGILVTLRRRLEANPVAR